METLIAFCCFEDPLETLIADALILVNHYEIPEAGLNGSLGIQPSSSYDSYISSLCQFLFPCRQLQDLESKLGLMKFDGQNKTLGEGTVLRAHILRIPLDRASPGVSFKSELEVSHEL